MSDDRTEYVLVTERFHPDTASSTGQYMTDLAAGLQERGLDMTVYTRRLEGDADRPELADVTVRRVPVPEVPQETFVGRFVNWFTFLGVVVPLLLLSRPDRPRELIFVTYPTVMPPLLWFVCRVRAWEYTYIIYDFYPACAVQLGYLERGGAAHRVWALLNRALLSDASNVVALGPVMRDRIVESGPPGFEAGKVEIIHNWADPEFITPQSKSENPFSREHDLVRPFTLVYSGNVGEYHDVETVLRGVAAWDQKRAEEYGGVKLLVIGEGDNKSHLVDVARELGVEGDCVEFLPYQPWEVVPDSFTSGDVSVVAVNSGFEGLCVSSKLYSALAAGQPVLVVSKPDDDEARIVEQFDAGIHVAPGDTAAVGTALERWLAEERLVTRQGENARAAFESHFTPEHSIDQYYEMLVTDERRAVGGREAEPESRSETAAGQTGTA
jgi:glycosyltransferase involved in cell wall biosynthesis